MFFFSVWNRCDQKRIKSIYISLTLCWSTGFCFHLFVISNKESFETYAPLSTLMERMLSSPHSWMLQHSEVNSRHLPWKCSCSNTVTCGDRSKLDTAAPKAIIKHFIYTSSRAFVYLEERSHAHSWGNQGLDHWGPCSSVHLYSWMCGCKVKNRKFLVKQCQR